MTTDPVTPEPLYRNRRAFLKLSIWAGTGAATASLFKAFVPDPSAELTGADIPTTPVPGSLTHMPDPGDSLSTVSEITNYNNFYEFSTSKAAVSWKAEDFITSPWKVTVEGWVHTPRIYDMSDLMRREQVERVYRLRCVEGWSMVIPWVGFPLHTLLAEVKPLGKATHVAFESYYDPSQMPDAAKANIPFPYVEGLRLDEAMHPLTFLATGLYGKTLPNQNGAPIRLVVPWKYGFKSAKSIVRITLTDREPPTTWNRFNPLEYGFYSNVNPEVDHPRWSQTRERRIGENETRPTLPFNGYGDQVASLYKGMDLMSNF